MPLSKTFLAGCVVFAGLFSEPLLAVIINVDCDVGETISNALVSVKSGDKILVRGICRESLLVPGSLTGVTLDGQGQATIVGPAADPMPTNPGDFAVFVLGKDIRIQGFTIKGGSHAVHLSGPANAVINGNVIRNSGGAIHLDKGSIGQIYGNIIEHNRNFGINIIENSYARVGFSIPTNPTPIPNIIRNNDGPGIIVGRRSSAWIVGNSIEANRGHGVIVDRTSQADIIGNSISKNFGDGIYVSHSSGVNIDNEGSERSDSPNHTEHGAPNQGFGISCIVGGYVSGPQGSLTGIKGTRNFEESCINRVD